MKEKLHQNAEMIRLWTQVIVRVILLLAALVIVGWLLFEVRTLLLLLVVSVFFCYLVAPIVHLIEQPFYFAKREFRLPRAVAITLVYILMAVVLSLGAQLIWPPLSQQVADLAKDLPGYAKSAEASVNKVFNDANSWMRHLRLPPQWRDAVFVRAGELANSGAFWLTESLAGALGYLQYLTWPILVPVLSFFLLKDAGNFERNLVALLPNERLQKRVHWLLMDVSRTLAAYIRAQLTACLVVGSVMMLGLTLIRAPYPVVLGAIGGLLEFIPLVGPLISALVIFGLALTVSFKTALIVAAFLAVLRLVQDYFIYPKIVGRGIKMHPLAVITAILAGAEIGGLIGIFLSIPVVGLLIVFYNHYLAYRGIQNLTVVTEPQEGEGEPELASRTTAPIVET
ncbi:MAG TPA: AI-2E family transporter [Blastocatellia bacterium]|nr:AI-2E family transporter [Blastocatellia bacterium]